MRREKSLEQENVPVLRRRRGENKSGGYLREERKKKCKTLGDIAGFMERTHPNMSKSPTLEYSGPKRSKPPLTIDNKTALWLMRMCVGEGGARCRPEKAAALLWAIVNRWFLWPGARFYPTFVSMLRAFSQPINPRWMAGGDLARKYIGRNEASAKRLARRARICALRWDQIAWPIRRTVAAMANQELASPFSSRASNWASLPSTPKKYPWGEDVDGDWFFEDKNLRRGEVVYCEGDGIG